MNPKKFIHYTDFDTGVIDIFYCIFNYFMNDYGPYLIQTKKKEYTWMKKIQNICCH